MRIHDLPLSGFRLSLDQPVSIKKLLERAKLVGQPQYVPVMLPLHVYANLKRQCDEGQRCAPLPTGYPQCPCNCGGPFGDCLR